MLAKIRMLDESDPPRIVKVRVPMTVGRGREAGLTLAHSLVSRMHCEFYEVDGVLCIRDLGSLNGTYIGDVRITEAALESGDVIAIGAFRFELTIEEGVPSPPAVDEANDAAATSDVILEIDESEESIASTPIATPQTGNETATEDEELPPLMPPGVEAAEEVVEVDAIDEVAEVESLDDSDVAEDVSEVAEVEDIEEVSEVGELIDDVPEFAEIDEVPLEEAEPEEAVAEVEAVEVEPEPLEDDQEPPPSEESTIQRTTKPAPARPAQPTDKKSEPTAPAGPAKKASGGADFGFLDADQKESEQAGASDKDLNEFFKGIG